MGEMHDQSDAQLLRDYAERGVEGAFAEIVARHTDLVYSAALRQVYSSDLARDVTQSVFTDLARKARSGSLNLSSEANLVGWLYRGTRFAARDLNRNETRRTQRERQAMEQLHPTPEAQPDWEQLRPVLDDAMAELDDTDRDAVLLRYFKNHDLRTVGATLGISDDAAQKRVSRAVERLREIFAKRGITASASGLAVVISANAVQAAPAGLALTVSAAATLVGTTLATTATVTATKAIAMTALQKTIVTATVAVLAGVGIYEARQGAQLQEQVQTLQEQQAPLAEQVQKLQREGESAAQRIAALREDNDRLNRNTGELLRLRGVVAQLRKDSQDLANLKTSITSDQPSAESWLARVNLLKQRLEQTPEARIPELRFVDEFDWLQAARRELKTENDYRKALSLLRTSGEGKFATQAEMALRKYLKANDDRFPTELAQLKPYFAPHLVPPIDDAILQRWNIVPTTNGNSGFGGDWVITQKSPVDEDYDARCWIGPNGQGQVGMGSFKIPQVKEVTANTNLVREAFVDPNDALAVLPALKAYAAANDGQQVANASQLIPYLTTPEQKLALLRLGGEMGLVGVALGQGNNNLPKVLRVLPESSAEKVGIEAGSFILSIDGVNTAGKSVAESVGMIQGRSGTTVILEVIDPAMSKTNKVLVNRVKK